MIQVGSTLAISDNSGAKYVECIKVYGKKQTASLGDTILVSVKALRMRQRGKVTKGEMVKALITETRKSVKRKNGSFVSSSRNAAILLTAQHAPYGTRVLGPVPHELRAKKYVKILSLATHVV